MLPNLGPAELVLIMGIALLVFGPKKLPEIGRGIGNALREFNKARNDFMETINSETDRDDDRPSEKARELPAAAVATDFHPGDAGAPSGRKIEYPESLDADSADALPYGADFHAVEGDSQPSFRAAQPEAAPVTSAARHDSA